MKSPGKTKRIDCIGLGIIPLDYLITVPKLPEPGGKIDGTSLCIQGGGPVPNSLTGLSRLGCSTALIAAVGDDIVGQVSIQEIKKEKIDTRYIIRKNLPSDSAYGFVEEGTGRRTIVLCRKMTIKPRDLKLAEYPIPRLVHLDGRDLEACIRLAKWGRRVGATITFDIGSIRNDVSPIFPLVDHLVVSDVYAMGFTKTRTIRQAIRKLTDHCPGTIVVTEGIKGSLGYENGQWGHHPAFKVKSVDTTGAGDSFHTGYFYGLLKGADLETRLRYGAAVAALKCMKPGAREGNPSLATLNRFLKGNPKTYA